jgi:1-aminocyclopropane-1-carboxylate deaminase
MLNRKCYIVPEGAFCKDAIAGASTLALDIIRNESELNIEFDHIFVDSGTGLTAMSLISSFSVLKSNKRY